MQRYDADQRRRAVEMVRHARGGAGTARGAIAQVAAETGLSPVTLGGWVRRADFADGVPTGNDEAHRRIVALEREVAELRRANALLRAKEMSRTVAAMTAARTTSGADRPPA